MDVKLIAASDGFPEQPVFSSRAPNSESIEDGVIGTQVVDHQECLLNLDPRINEDNDNMCCSLGVHQASLLTTSGQTTTNNTPIYGKNGDLMVSESRSTEDALAGSSTSGAKEKENTDSSTYSAVHWAGCSDSFSNSDKDTNIINPGYSRLASSSDSDEDTSVAVPDVFPFAQDILRHSHSRVEAGQILARDGAVGILNGPQVNIINKNYYTNTDSKDCYKPVDVEMIRSIVASVLLEVKNSKATDKQNTGEVLNKCKTQLEKTDKTIMFDKVNQNLCNFSQETCQRTFSGSKVKIKSSDIHVLNDNALARVNRINRQNVDKNLKETSILQMKISDAGRKSLRKNIFSYRGCAAITVHLVVVIVCILLIFNTLYSLHLPKENMTNTSLSYSNTKQIMESEKILGNDTLRSPQSPTNHSMKFINILKLMRSAQGGIIVREQPLPNLEISEGRWDYIAPATEAIAYLPEQKQAHITKSAKKQFYDKHHTKADQ